MSERTYKLPSEAQKRILSGGGHAEGILAAVVPWATIVGVLRAKRLLGSGRLARCNLTANTGVDLTWLVKAERRFGLRPFEKAHLAGCDLGGMSLEGVSLRDANLTGACCRHTRLARADLSRATLDRTDLRGADLRGAKLYVTPRPDLSEIWNPTERPDHALIDGILVDDSTRISDSTLFELRKMLSRKVITGTDLETYIDRRLGKDSQSVQAEAPPSRGARSQNSFIPSESLIRR